MGSVADLRYCAKYPFTRQSKEYLQANGRDFEKVDLDLLNLATERIKEAMSDDSERVKAKYNELGNSREEFLKKELMTYPLAKIIAALTKDRFILTKLGKYEAKKALHALQLEPDYGVVEEMSRQFFHVTETQDGLAVPFEEYLNNVPEDKQFRLINQKFHQGHVIIDKYVLSNLVAQHVFNSIVSMKLESEDLPKEFKYFADQLKFQRQKDYSKDLGEVKYEAFPPCMVHIIQDLQSDEIVSHQPRFLLATFLANIGMPEDECVKLFASQPNFDEEKTRYYLRHAAGKKSGTVYSVANCRTIESYGLCYRDKTCRWPNPMPYYAAVKKRVAPAETAQANE